MFDNILFKIKQIPDQKKQKMMIVVFLFVLLITSILVRESVFKKSKNKAPVTNVFTNFSAYIEPNINFKVLENSELVNLKSFEEILPLTGSYGRKNPFLPF